MAQTQQKRGGCLRTVGIIIVVSVVGVGALTFWFNQLFDRFHGEYLAGNCEVAEDIYDEYDDSPFENTLRSIAEEKVEQLKHEHNACDFIVRASGDVDAGRYARALRNYMRVRQDYPDTAVETVATERMDALIAEPEPILADADFCLDLDSFAAEDAPENLRALIADGWLNCASTLRDAGSGLGECSGCSPDLIAATHFGELVTYIERYAEVYPLEGQQDKIDAVLADVMARQAEAAGAGEITQPEGRSIGGSDAVIVIENAAPQSLRIALTNAATSFSTVESIEACADCPTYTGSGPAECPVTEQSGTLRVPPGTYSVIVNTVGGGVVTPYVGTWEMEAGTEYFQCFYIVRG